MGQKLRIESPTRISLITIKTQNNRLWFVNNRELEQAILGYLAMYVAKYGAIVFAFVIQGNHYHLVIQFPNMNRRAFCRDFNARFAQMAKMYVEEYEGGHLFARRYGEQILPLNSDVEYRVHYCYLQAVNSGLAEFPSQYPGYNSFEDAISGTTKRYKVVNWTKYRQKKRSNPKVTVEEFTTYYDLSYTRVPGFEEMSQGEYKKYMLNKAEQHRQAMIAKRIAEGNTKFLGPKQLQETLPGATPITSKTSAIDDYNPIVLTSCKIAHAEEISKHFAVHYPYKEASKRYLAGEKDVIFPGGTYKPSGPFVPS